MTQTYNIDEIMAVQGGKSTVASGESSLIEDIERSLAEMNQAKENANEAKAQLDRLIAEKLHDGADPFVAMLDAMLYVVPQLMKYKEEKLVEKTASFEYINSLNAYMAETQKNFAASSDADTPKDTSNSNGLYSYGNTSYTDADTGRVHGLKAGAAYQANLTTLSSGDLFAGLPSDIQAVLNGAIGDTLGLEGHAPDVNKWGANSQNGRVNYSLSETLWSGLNAPKWRMSNDTTDQYSNNLYSVSGGQKDADYDYFVNPKPSGKNESGISEASYLTSQLTPVVDEAVTQNAVMLSTLNGYSKKVESEFKFEMENYNTIVTLNGLMYSDQINLNDTHITRLRAK